jgi:hypothetical protein
MTYQQLCTLIAFALWHVCKQIKVKSNCSINGNSNVTATGFVIDRYLVEESGENGCRMEEGAYRQSILRFA